MADIYLFLIMQSLAFLFITSARKISQFLLPIKHRVVYAEFRDWANYESETVSTLTVLPVTGGESNKIDILIKNASILLVGYIFYMLVLVGSKKLKNSS